jgi:hypothetical protein
MLEQIQVLLFQELVLLLPLAVVVDNKMVEPILPRLADLVVVLAELLLLQQVLQLHNLVKILE